MGSVDEAYRVPRWDAWSRQPSQCSTIVGDEPLLEEKDFRDISSSTWDFHQGLTGQPSLMKGGEDLRAANGVKYVLIDKTPLPLCGVANL